MHNKTQNAWFYLLDDIRYTLYDERYKMYNISYTIFSRKIRAVFYYNVTFFSCGLMIKCKF